MRNEKTKKKACSSKQLKGEWAQISAARINKVNIVIINEGGEWK
ncbi:hypothetical protein [Paenibacillus donghaensis]|nr:hypothetical protein [Paenibacillus donghaensis]